MNRGDLWPRARSIRPLDWLVLAAIGFYQKQISPRKGWRCAHGVLHQGPSCSGYIKSAVQAHGWREAIPLAKQRFAECKLAGQTLRQQRLLQLQGGELPQDPYQGRRRRRNQNSAGEGDSNCPDCDDCDFSWCGITDLCQPGHHSCCDVPHCDCGGCDSCDCSSGN